jgi:Sugar-transfer associated ATP-grasp
VADWLDPLSGATELDRHPDSNFLVKDFQLPHWEATKRVACEALKAFPRMSIVGLDMAFGPDGPVLIELNVLPDYIGCAWIGLPLKRLERRMRGQR